MIDFIMKMATDGLDGPQRRAFMDVFWKGLLMFHIAWACGWLAAFGLPGFVQANEVHDVKNQVIALSTDLVGYQKTQRRLAMETELRRLDQEIFNIEAKISEVQRSGQQADRIYSERLSELRSERQQITSRLDSFMRANPEIAGGIW